MTLTHLLVGPRPHGVVRCGWELHRYMRADGFDVRRRWTAHHSLAEWDAVGAMHLQFTDRLFGDSPESAAGKVDSLRRAGQGAMTATLHDLPQPSDGTNFARRTRAYAAVSAACDGVVVSSQHELDLLHDCGITPARVAVIPLPIDSRPTAPPSGCADRTVGVFGFIYPGKGHAEVIAATPPDTEVLAIGETSQGHDDLASEFQDTAHRHGRTFRVTGYVPDSRLSSVLRQVSVPVVAHRHISASGSINSWLAAGRRPLAPTHRYTVEFESRNPGSLTLYPDTHTGLRTAIESALATPESTWLPVGTVLNPAPSAVASHYNNFFASFRR